MNRSPQRRRVEVLAERIALILAAFAVLYWAWLIAGEDLAALSWNGSVAKMALLIPATAVLLLGAICAHWLWPSSGRTACQLVFLSVALFWLSCFYWTMEGPAARFPTPAGLVYRAVLALSVCFVGMLFVNWSMSAAKMHQALLHHLVFGIGMLITLAFTGDLFMSTKPPRPISVPSQLYKSQYHPVFTYRPQGSYVLRHEQQRVVADFRGVTFSQRKPEGVRRIVLNGASTMWGHMLAAEDCLRARIEAGLKEKFPDRRWEVLCIAYPGKYQMNELVDTAVTLPHWKPDLIISFNGYNDVWFIEGPSLYVGMPYIEDQITLGRFEATLASFTHSGQWMASMARMGNRPQPRSIKADLSEPPRYYSHLRLTARTLRSCGIPYAFCFCPNVYEVHERNRGNRRKRYRRKTPRGQGDSTTSGEKFLEMESDMRDFISVLAASEPTLAALVDRRRNSEAIVREEGQISFDATMCLLDQSSPVFLDPSHLNGAGTQAVADEIVNSIPRWLAAWSRQSSTGPEAQSVERAAGALCSSTQAAPPFSARMAVRADASRAE
jgi:hypothetical protein